MNSPAPERRQDQPSRPISDSACILWHPPGAPPPRDLLQNLTKHGANIHPCHDAFTALALACRSTRNQPLTESPGAQVNPGNPRAVLILLVDPESLPAPGAARFVRTVRRYAPRSACWWYSRSAAPPFRVITSADMARWESLEEADGEAAADVGAMRATVEGPVLRLTSEAPGVDGRAASVMPEPKPRPGVAPVDPPVSSPAVPPAEEAAARSALTADELAMLLGEPDPIPMRPSMKATPPTDARKSP